jgi:hypothetical protein
VVLKLPELPPVAIVEQLPPELELLEVELVELVLDVLEVLEVLEVLDVEEVLELEQKKLHPVAASQPPEQLPPEIDEHAEQKPPLHEHGKFCG